MLYVVFINNDLFSSSCLCIFQFNKNNDIIIKKNSLLVIIPYHKIIAITEMKDFLYLARDDNKIERYQIFSYSDNIYIEKKGIILFPYAIHDMNVISDNNRSLLFIREYNKLIFLMILLLFLILLNIILFIIIILLLFLLVI